MMRSIFVLFFVSLALVGVMHAEEDEDSEEKDTSTLAVNPPEIRFLHIETNVAYRFATTRVVSMLANVDQKAREAVFNIQLPKSAFITTFSMEIEGVTYDGTVKEKEQARQEYIEAKRRGQSAGHIAAKPRNTNSFDVSVNVAPQQKVTFHLTYQELLQRALGMYKNVLYINPGQVVDDLKVDVFINESREITKVRVPAIQKDAKDALETVEDNPHATINTISPTFVHISYYPSADVQRLLSAKGISGQLVVQYDVTRGYDAGDIQVVDGYFVHFIAPSGLPPVRKNVLFILDISGSMSGRKLAQTKDALKVILPDLHPSDLFNIFLFDDRVVKWNDTNLVPVNDDTLRLANQYVTDMRAVGSTDINKALLEGIKFLDDQKKMEKPLNPSSLIVFLTDGDPTSGVTNIDRILSNVRKANKLNGYSIFSLGFGKGVDFGFLRKISYQNNGMARKIYEDSDAAIQLQGFYKEISTPLLTDVKVTYIDAEKTTKKVFPNYFNGSEIVICGMFNPDGSKDDIFRTTVGGKSNGADIVIAKEVEIMDSTSGLRASTERLWAYLTIKELLDKMDQTANATKKANFEKKALEMSLKYSFVTPLTSMIVKKPDQNDSASGLTDSDSQPVQESGYGVAPPVGLSSPTGQQHRTFKSSHQQVGYSVPVAYDADLMIDPVPIGLSGGNKGSNPVPVQPVHRVDSVMLHGIEGPRIQMNTSSGESLCHDVPVQDGETRVLKMVGRAATEVYATFTRIQGEQVLTSVRLLQPKKSLTVVIDLTKLEILCHGTSQTKTWLSLEGTNTDLVMPGMPGPRPANSGSSAGHHGRQTRGQPPRGQHHRQQSSGQSGRGQSRHGVWATMEGHNLRIHLVHNKLCLFVSRAYDDGILSHYLNLKLSAEKRPVPTGIDLMGNHLASRLSSNGDLTVSGSRTPLAFSNPMTSLEFVNPFTSEEDECKFI